MDQNGDTREQMGSRRAIVPTPFNDEAARLLWQGIGEADIMETTDMERGDEMVALPTRSSSHESPPPPPIELGASFQESAAVEFSTLAENRLDEVLQSIKHKGMKKLGDISVKDGVALAAFGSNEFITRGRSICNDINVEAFWKSELKNASKGKTLKMGWSRDVVLSAYVIKAGSCEEDVLKLPALRATIDYKWEAWAGKLLTIELILYIGWLLSYSLFLYFFLMQGTQSDWRSPAASVYNVLSFLLMCPFFIIEIFTIRAYKLGWFSLWSIIDLGCFSLQVTIFLVYFGNFNGIDEDWFSACLAVESILIFLRIQYYARAFGSVNVSFVDTLKVVLKEVRWFFFFVFLTISSFALAFAALFRKEEIEDQKLSTDFLSVWRAFLTTFSFMLGGFQTEYFFQSVGWTPIATSLLFAIFEILVAVTLLNLLVAIMIDSYAKIKKDESLLRDLNRAHVIDELEMTLPSFLMGTSHEYIHMLVIKQDRGEMFPPSLVPKMIARPSENTMAY
ncbi:hypothetical protein BSKO_12084 [Bryopsis sp. KO-2023]|nr:hypothetical protein BSKO_12084 [Bryopsis sp. KO-2023]